MILDEAARRDEVNRVLKGLKHPAVMGITYDVESTRILHAATAAFVAGVDVAAIICAHASTERDLLSRAVHWEEHGDNTPDGNFMYWGLGKLLQHFATALPPVLAADLATLNLQRKTLYHYGHSEESYGLHPSSLEFVEQAGYGTIAEAWSEHHAGRGSVGHKDVLELATDALLQQQALNALSTAWRTREWFSGLKGTESTV